jgi:hypothetical protein
MILVSYVFTFTIDNIRVIHIISIVSEVLTRATVPDSAEKEIIMISLFVSDDVVATLINQEFEDMLRSYEWEQENKWELEAEKALRELKASMKKYYEEGNMEAFQCQYSVFSDIYKDLHGVRPHWYLETCDWFHGC